jgi:hypothetical protein
MLAQTTDPISGGAGWVGAGLLGLVLSWLLLKYLPDKDRQLKELIDAKDKALKDKDDAHAVMLTSMWLKHREQLAEFVSEAQRIATEQRAEFRITLQMVIEHCRSDTASQTTAIVKELQHLGERIEGPRPGKPT